VDGGGTTKDERIGVFLTELFEFVPRGKIIGNPEVSACKQANQPGTTGGTIKTA